MPRLINRQIIFAIKQPNVNAPVSPGGADAILASNIQFSYVDEKLVEREALRSSSMGPLAPCFATRRAQLSFDTEIRGSGTAGVAPECNVLLQIAGYQESINPGTNASYNLLADPSPDANGSWATIDFYTDREFHRLVNCVATHTTTISANNFAVDSWTITGQLQSINTNQPQAVPVYQTTKPIVPFNLPFSYPGGGAGTGHLSSFEFDLANEILNEETLQSSLDGFVPAEIVARGPITGSINPLMQLGAPTIDYNTLLTNNTIQSLGVGAIGSVAGNICQFNFPACQVTGVQMGERTKLLSWDISLRFSETSALNDEVSRIYT